MDMEVFCCDMLRRFAWEDEDRLIEYLPQLREFGLPYSERAGGGFVQIHYCPWCGTKLPPDLRDEWFDVVTHLVGREEVSRRDPDVPEEYKTDEWWSGRGL